MNKPRVILADDEPNLLRFLSDMLHRLWPELEIVDTAGNGMQALGLIRDVEPDIAFLDIKMPVLTGLQVAQRIAGECHVVFITAYDEFAVQAFEASAVDYLLKPVDEQRLQQTIDRLKKLNQSEPETNNLSLLLSQLAGHASKQTPQYLNWIRAGDSENTYMVPIDEVIYFKAEDKYTTVVTQDKEHLIRKPIRELVAELDPIQFWQIHRGIIVQTSQIASLKKAINGTYHVSLRGSKDQLTVSRRYAHLFKQM
ncbi:MAG: LytTR family DNA-binding domain-containing protein [Gammaproteobacteria bacterium]|nr:LytTR family DNA-binding domain-containing protein [Gammaproteobacteria bacterium]